MTLSEIKHCSTCKSIVHKFCMLNSKVNLLGRLLYTKMAVIFVCTSIGTPHN